MQALSQNDLTLMAIVAVVALILGFIIGRATGKSPDGKNAQQVHDDLASYKKAVNEHFDKTADLVDNLTQSYKAVFEHLGESARTLLTEEEVKQHLASRADKTVTLTYNNQTASAQGQKKTAAKDDSPALDTEKKAEKKVEEVVKKADNNCKNPAKKTPEKTDKAIEKTAATAAHIAAKAEKSKTDGNTK